MITVQLKLSAVILKSMHFYVLLMDTVIAQKVKQWWTVVQKLCRVHSHASCEAVLRHSRTLGPNVNVRMLTCSQ